MPSLKDWLTAHGLVDIVPFSEDTLKRVWDPTQNDTKAAADLFAEMDNRIITKNLPYRSGDEKTALDSVYSFFKFKRELSKQYAATSPCFELLADLLVEKTVRPFTARWHKISLGGGFADADTCRAFRRDLVQLQAKIRPIHRLLAALAGKSYTDDSPQLPNLPGGSIAVSSLQGVANPEVLAKEKGDIAKRRSKVASGQDANATDLEGLAISGGGIRSATFALGVIQCLAERGMLNAVDYLSTVSGGGYIGSFISSYLNSDITTVGPGAKQLPFDKVENNESPPIRHMRNHSKYLAEGDWLYHLRTGGQVAYGVLTNLLVIFPFLALAALASFIFQREDIANALTGHYVIHLHIATQAMVVLLTCLVAGLAIVQNLGRIGPRLTTLCTWYEVATVLCLAGTVIFIFCDLQPALFAAFHWAAHKTRAWSHLAVAATVPPIIGVAVVLLKRHPALSKLMMTLFWFSGPLAFLIVYFAITRQLVMNGMHVSHEVPWWQTPTPILDFGPFPLWYFVVSDVAIIVYCFTLLNVNTTSPHTFYRDQVASAYLLKPVQAAHTSADPTPKVETRPNTHQTLAKLNESEKAPYHLLNGALNLSASKVPDLRGRESDFFLFSKYFCGSPILGYFPTKHWESLDAHLNLATAMAISGAAAAPIMGMGSIFGASFMLALLNVRLAYWMRVPKQKPPTAAEKALAWLKGPGPLYVLREMAGLTDEKSRFVNVSDGGHLENLGVYELLRRKCKFIIAIDGECDEKMVFPSLLRAIRFAKIDFGIDIDINLDDLRLGENGYSKAHWALGEIKYDDVNRGLLLYIKSSMTGNEPDYVKAYRSKEPTFPHESTAKQLFAEDQFEAYRAVGHHAASELFQAELMVVPLTNQSSIRDWFQRLANSLLP